jgi:di/tricarboxylate transporter
VVPAAVAGLMSTGAMVLLGVLTMEQAYRAIHWTAIIMVESLLSQVEHGERQSA